MTTIDRDAASAYAEDAEGDAPASENILSRITRLTREAQLAEADVLAAEAVLKAAQDRYRNLVEFLLPNAMVEAEQDKLRTSDGLTLELKEQLVASIPAAQQEHAFAWLTANNQDAIIKRAVSLQFGKGEDQKAAEAIDTLMVAGFAPTDKRSVHPQTLAATIKELLKEGVDVPMDLLGAHVRRSVKISAPQ